MTEGIILTAAGLKKLQDELEYLKREKRVQVAERIKVAKDYGDLSENAEYLEAKEEQSFVEGRILEIEQILKRAHVVEKKNSLSIDIGSTVVLTQGIVKNRFKIVGSTESDPANGKISVDSPLGNALVGKKKGDHLELTTPAGIIQYFIDSAD